MDTQEEIRTNEIIQLLRAAYKKNLISAKNTETKNFFERRERAAVLELGFKDEEASYKLALQGENASVTESIEPAIRASRFVTKLVNKISAEYSCLTAVVTNKDMNAIEKLVQNAVTLINGNSLSEHTKRNVVVDNADGKSDVIEYEIQARFKISYEKVKADKHVSENEYVEDSFYVTLDGGKIQEIKSSDTNKETMEVSAETSLKDEQKHKASEDVQTLLSILQGSNHDSTEALTNAMNTKKQIIRTLLQKENTVLRSTLTQITNDCDTKGETLANIRISLMPLHIFVNRRQMATVRWEIFFNDKNTPVLETNEVKIDVAALEAGKRFGFSIRNGNSGGVELAELVCGEQLSSDYVQQFYAAYYQKDGEQMKTVLSVSKKAAEKFDIRNYVVTLGKPNTEYAKKYQGKYYIQPEVNDMIVQAKDGYYYLQKDATELGQEGGTYRQTHQGWYPIVMENTEDFEGDIALSENGCYYFSKDLIRLGKEGGRYRKEVSRDKFLYVNPDIYPKENNQTILKAENGYYYLKEFLIQLGKEKGNYRKKFSGFYVDPQQVYGEENEKEIVVAAGEDNEQRKSYYLKDATTELGKDDSMYRKNNPGFFVKPNAQIFGTDAAEEVCIEQACDGFYYKRLHMENCAFGERFCATREKDKQPLLSGSQHKGFSVCGHLCSAISDVDEKKGRKCKAITQGACSVCGKSQFFVGEGTYGEYSRAFRRIQKANAWVCEECIRKDVNLLVNESKSKQFGDWYPNGVYVSNGNDTHVVMENGEMHLTLATKENSCPICGEYRKTDVFCLSCRTNKQKISPEKHSLIGKYISPKKIKASWYFVRETQKKPGHLFVYSDLEGGVIDVYDFIVQKDGKGKLISCILNETSTII